MVRAPAARQICQELSGPAGRAGGPTVEARARAVEPGELIAIGGPGRPEEHATADRHRLVEVPPGREGTAASGARDQDQGTWPPQKFR